MHVSVVVCTGSETHSCMSLYTVQEGDVLELISREGIHWFLARNVMDPTYLHEGLVNERHLRIIKKLPEETQQVRTLHMLVGYTKHLL